MPKTIQEEASENAKTYKKVKTLGKGEGFAVYVVETEDKERAIMKQVDLKLVSDEARMDVMKEAKKLEDTTGHPNIVLFKDVKKTKAGKLYIMTDYIDGTTLSEQVQEMAAKNAKSRKPDFLSEEKLLSCFAQICMAMKHIMDKNIIHKDLKSSNVLLTKGGTVKLQMHKADSTIGTPFHMAPELFNTD